MSTLNAPAPVRDIGIAKAHTGQVLNLLAGHLYFGHAPSSIRTLLGSCVAVTLWHPHKRIGGMCHFLLPMRPRTPDMPRDARYGDEAMHYLAESVKRHGTQPHEYEVHLYGGADTMPDQAGVKFNVGERNIEAGWQLIDQYGFTLQGVDVGDFVPRTVVLDMATGEVRMNRGETMKKSA
jgi:chemotaxis protein CheD